MTPREQLSESDIMVGLKGGLHVDRREHGRSRARGSLCIVRHHLLIIACIFAASFVSYWERLGFSIAFTEVATKMRLSETEKGAIFAAYYYGLSITPILGGYLATKYGGRTILILSFLLWAPISSLTSFAASDARTIVPGVITCRILIGLAQGMFFPAAFNVLGHWVPSTQRGRYFTLSVAGSYAGAATAMVTVPRLVVSIGALSVFHVAAGLAVAWLVLWVIAGPDAPDGDALDTEYVDGDGVCEQMEAIEETSNNTNKEIVQSRSVSRSLPMVPHCLSSPGAPSGGRVESRGYLARAYKAVLRNPPRNFADRGTSVAVSRTNKVQGATPEGYSTFDGTARTSRGCKRRCSQDAEGALYSTNTPVLGEDDTDEDRCSGCGEDDENEVIQVVSRNLVHYGTSDDVDRRTDFPWKSMLCSSAAWACVAGNVGCTAGVAIVMSWQPTYFVEFLEVDLDDLGLANQLCPYLTMLASTILGGVLYSRLINEYGLSKALASKIVTTSAFYLALGCFLAMGLATTALTGTLLVSGTLASLAISRGGWSTNHAEIAAPEQGSMLYSIASCISSIATVVGISLTGKVMDIFGGANDPMAWTFAMGLVGVMCGVCGTFYAMAAGGDHVLFPSSKSCQKAQVPVGRHV